MTRPVSSVTKEEPNPVMQPAEERKRLPRSVRKHIRRAKAALRREHGATGAEKAIEQLVLRFRK